MKFEPYLMPFGKFKGSELKDIDRSYLEWLLGSTAKLKTELCETLGYEENKDLKEQLEYWKSETKRLNTRLASANNRIMDLESKTSNGDFQRQCSLLHKRLAMKHHPDRQGDLETMKIINGIFDELSKVIFT